MTIPFDKTRPIDVICMGRVAVDLYAEQIHRPLAEVATFRKYLGGCAGNIAVGTSRLGLNSMMFSCTGTDAMGQFLRDTLIKEGVNIDLLYESDHLTGLVLLGIDPPHHFPLIFYRNDCADMQLKAAHINIEIIKKSKSLLLTGTGLSTEPMYNTTLAAIQAAKSVATSVIMDLDYRPVLWKLTALGDGETRYKANEKVSHTYQTILPFCDLIIGTEEEILIASGEQTKADAICSIQQLTNAPIVVKLGEKGCEVYINKNSPAINSRPFPVRILNVLGAGDGFMSGLLCGLLKGESWQTATTYANAAGALVVTRHGCAPAIPNLAELHYFIHHYDQDPLVWQSDILAQLHEQPKEVSYEY